MKLYPILFLLAIPILILIGIFTYKNLPQPPATSSSTVSFTPPDQAPTGDLAPSPSSRTNTSPPTNTSTTTQSSRYLDYSPESFAAHQNQRRVLYFHADWCPICRPLDRAFQARASEIPQDAIIFKTNYDTEKQLKNKYAVTYQHTFVQVDSQDNQLDIWSGGDFDSVISHIQ